MTAPALPARYRSVLRSRRGFSILELIIAISLTMVIAVVVFQIYKIAIDSYIDIRGSIQNLQAYRNAVDKIEIEMSGIVAKACYLPNNREIDDPLGSGFKALDEGIFRTRFLRHQLGFYTSTSPARIDRVIYYHNRSEDEEKLNNNVDDDNDDSPTIPLGHFVDDNGHFMVWRRNDKDLSYADYSALMDGSADTLEDGTPNPKAATEPFFNPFLNETGPTSFGIQEGTPQVAGTKDYGEILARSVNRVTFSYVWTQKGPGGVGIDPKFQYAPVWPHKAYDAMTGLPADVAAARVTTDLTGYKYGLANVLSKDHQKGLSFLALPIAVQVNFEFIRNGESEFLNKTIYIYRSNWNDYLSRATP